MTLANEWFTLKPETVKVDVYRNSAESAVRMTHLPTGIVVEHHFRFSDSYSMLWRARGTDRSRISRSC
jgi:protein subunit release factor B